MSDYDVTKYFQDRQQRFEAALKFATTACEYSKGYSPDLYFPTVETAVEMADKLLTHLEETEK